MLIRLLCAHEMNKYVCKISRLNSKRLLRKLQKLLGGYFILPHPVDSDMLRISRNSVYDIRCTCVGFMPPPMGMMPPGMPPFMPPMPMPFHPPISTAASSTAVSDFCFSWEFMSDVSVARSLFQIATVHKCNIDSHAVSWIWIVCFWCWLTLVILD